MPANRLSPTERTIGGVTDEFKMDAPENLFHRAMVSIYDYVLIERRYDANRFLNLLVTCGGVMTAKEFLSAPSFGAGFEGLWKRGPAEKTMEYLVLQPAFSGLFTDEEKETARTRLLQCGHIEETSE